MKIRDIKDDKEAMELLRPLRRKGYTADDVFHAMEAAQRAERLLSQITGTKVGA